MSDEPRNPPQNQPAASRTPRVVSLRHPGTIGPKPAPAAPQIPRATAASESTPTPAPAAAPGGESIAAHSRLLVETIIGTFTERLKSEVAKRGGRLYTEDIDRIALELDGKRAQLEAVFRKTFETYVQARERAAFDHAREFPFDRLIVNTFAELFTPKRAELDGDDRVTRKVLPGFFMALDRMLPPERLAEYQERCRKILARIDGGDENVLDWRALYADPDANILLLDALVALVPHFEAYEKRRNWFLPLVNDNLQKNESDNWELSPRGFINLTMAMFSPLRNELRDIAGRSRMVERYGPADCQNLQRIIDKMWGPSPVR
ncbi:MAG: hypothetical protein K0Q70_562 [Rhodospirillales bacterium]|jgi:hypothetical protein|nr:hypothetical protein [Rhodospirillales bacterium]